MHCNNEYDSLTTVPDIYYDMLALVPIGGKGGGILCITRELSNFLFASEVIHSLSVQKPVTFVTAKVIIVCCTKRLYD